MQNSCCSLCVDLCLSARIIAMCTSLIPSHLEVSRFLRIYYFLPSLTRSVFSQYLPWTVNLFILILTWSIITFVVFQHLEFTNWIFCCVNVWCFHSAVTWHEEGHDNYNNVIIMVKYRKCQNPCRISVWGMDCKMWSQVCVQFRASAVNVTQPAFATRAATSYCCGAGRAAIDWYLLPVRPTAANPPHAATVGEWDRRTPYRYIDPAPHTMQAVPITNNSVFIPVKHTCGLGGGVE